MSRKGKVYSFPTQPGMEVAQPQPPKKERNHTRRNGILIGVVAVAGTASVIGGGLVLSEHLRPKPSIVLEGTAQHDGKPLDIQGGAILNCGGIGPAHVFADVRTIVDVPDDGLAPKGRVYEIDVTTGDQFCTDALKTVRSHPELLSQPLVDAVSADVSGVLADGTYEAADTFAADIKDAQNAGAPVVHISK